MTARILLILAMTVSLVSAADPAPEDLLRQGLFEEEANRDFDKAADRYRAVIAAHDRQRAHAATATFRLAEIARKKQDKDAAAAAFRTVIERFPEQEGLARLSRENLAALGMAPTSPDDPAPPADDPEADQISRLREIARNSPDLLDGANNEGWRPIHQAAAMGWLKVMAYLLENKADPNGRTTTEELTPLHVATIHGHLEAVKFLLRARADPTATFEIERYPANQMQLPARIGAGNAKGTWTALDLAILQDRREIARILLQSGADPKRFGPLIKPNAKPFTPLMLAIHLRRDDLAMELIGAGSPLDHVGDEHTASPLFLSIRENPRMVGPLLKAGADPDAVGAPDWCRPLSGASMMDRLDIAKLLIDAGADPKTSDSSGNTPLHFANSQEMVDLLISNGADPNSKNKEGVTPLDMSVVRRDGESSRAVFERLLHNGGTSADPKALLRSTSEAMLPIVRELVVYPKEQRPDAILLSLDGAYQFEGDGGRLDGARLTELEVRPSEDSPPPSLAEALRMVFSEQNFVRSIRILRRKTDGHFETIRVWVQTERVAMPKDWPALEWGDIVELSISGSHSGSEPQRIHGLLDQIPSRTITVRLGEISFQQSIPGDGRFWTDGWHHNEKIFPSQLEEFLDLSRFTVRRKGSAQPIQVDFANRAGGPRFHFIDGDTVEMSFDPKELKRRLPPQVSTAYVLRTFGVDYGIASVGIGLAGGSTSGAAILSNVETLVESNLAQIGILRKAENWNMESLDLAAWLDSLPEREKWDREQIAASEPKFQSGDVILLSENPDKKAAEKARSARAKLKEVADFLTVSRRIVLPPTSAPPPK
jgi:ankyrin repeat protein